MRSELRKIVRAAATRTLAMAAVGLAMLASGGLAATEKTTDQLWLISTRRTPICDPAGAKDIRLDYWHLDDDNRWLPADREAFLAADDPAVPTSFFIHGNRVDRDDAVRSGWKVYRRLHEQAAGRRLRFVIWSWPADRVRGRNRRDVRVKAARSDVQGHYLARCVNRIDPGVPLSMVGYSFGARVITGALHMLGGGRLAGRSLPEAAARQAPVRVVLVAAALDADWLLPGRYNGLALGQLDRMLITQNACDPVLKRYPLMYCIRGPQALGYTGPACLAQLGPDRKKIELLRLGCSVGKAHKWNCYLSAPSLRRRLAWYAFVEPPEPDTALQQPPLPELSAASAETAGGGQQAAGQQAVGGGR